MNAMIRVLKGTLAVLALVGLGLALRWMTDGSISGVRTYDLDSLTVLAVGTVAWIAYGWLVLAVLMTVLEQIPGVVGALAGAVAGRITTKTARAILRSGLGVAAVTPLTVGVAHATPGDSAHVRQWDQTEPKSTVQFGDSNWRATEPRSTVEIAGTEERGNADYRATEPRSTVEIGGAEANQNAPQQSTGNRNDFRAAEPPSQVHITGTPTTPGQSPIPGSRTAGNPAQTTPGRPGTSGNSTTPGDPTAPATPGTPGRPAAGTPGRPAAGGSNVGRPADVRMRVGVPDRPTDGAPTRYTELRPGVPVRVVVREGDSLWSIAARELGPGATDEAIAARWPDWYAANRHVIGDNPDLILPGQVLRIPPTHGDHLPNTHQEK